MPAKALRRTVCGVLALLVLAGGCSSDAMKDMDRFWKSMSRNPSSRDATPTLSAVKPPPDIEGTVAEYAGIVGGGLLVDGHGLVVGLGKNGSADVPPGIRKYLTEYMLKQNVGSAMAEMSAVTPASMIADTDTAVARVIGIIPPGAPRGWRFDLRVSALSRTSTRSLDGGTFYPFPMHVASGEGQPPSTGSRQWAEAQGSVFINPFLDPTNRKDTIRYREGRIIGGGRVIESRPLRLMLREADYAMSNNIQRAVNGRFGSNTFKPANAKTATMIELKVPPAYADDYEHYLQLVLHLPLQTDPSKWEVRAMKIGQEIEKPEANAEGLAMVWEAMGPQVVNSCRQHYASRNPAASFYSARTGLRLYDDTAGDVLTQIARTAGSPFQIAAIRELGRHRRFFRSLGALRELIDDPSELVRIAAYEALAELDDKAVIQRETVGDFELDLVASRRKYVIYATQAKTKRIALFGNKMQVARRVFFDMPNPFDPAKSVVTIAEKEVDVDAMGRYVNVSKLTPAERARRVPHKQRKLMVFRSIPQTGGISEPFYLDHDVASLVRTMGNPAMRDKDFKIMGLDLNYSQVVAVLYRMCEVSKSIPARFVLQDLPGREKIYRDVESGGRPALGRPDMPGE